MDQNLFKEISEAKNVYFNTLCPLFCVQIDFKDRCLPCQEDLRTLMLTLLKYSYLQKIISAWFAYIFVKIFFFFFLDIFAIALIYYASWNLFE